MPDNQYRHNHYVPKWYQKRFIPVGQVDNELYYLSLKPLSPFIDPRGNLHSKDNPKRQGLRLCFAQEDLYTTQLGETVNTEIEKRFFGKIDTNGRQAVEFFASFNHTAINGKAIDWLLLYMSIQKLRTPKGMEWLATQADAKTQIQKMILIQRLQSIYAITWGECVWQIADASNSSTKFIVSDHPVTVYNRACGPMSPKWCRSLNDPDIRLNATHTIFPLSLDKVLILTNRSWVLNPYQKETHLKPNPTYYHENIFNFTEVQISRYLTELEVMQINFIIKSRAYQYVAAANPDWLYPEKHISKSDWHNYGDGFLLMPDPRSLSYTSEIVIGYQDGSTRAYDPYGREPWEKDYQKEVKNDKDFDLFTKFKGEFALKFGANRRGRSFESPEADPPTLNKAYITHAQKKKGTSQRR